MRNTSSGSSSFGPAALQYARQALRPLPGLNAKSIFLRFSSVFGLLVALALPCFAQPMPGDVRQAFQQEVRPALALPEDERARYGSIAESMLRQAGIYLVRAQYVLVVDRNVNVQAAMLYWLQPGGPPLYIGASPVSTGKTGRFDHFETPTGVYPHTLDNPDFRAEGTRNKNGILGYGRRGMRVYDFGWQSARRGWGKGGIGTMRLQMHATDPHYLEPKLGTAQSQGCIRIAATLNRLIDRLGLLDMDYETYAGTGTRLWVLLPDRNPAYGAGRYLIITDTARSQRPAWSRPERAK